MAFPKKHIPWNKGIKLNKEQKERINTDGLLLGHLAGKDNHNWKGNKAGYHAIHLWIKRNYGKAKVCIKCKSTENVEWANISGKYKRDILDYIQLCKACHCKYDDYVNKAWETRRGNYA